MSIKDFKKNINQYSKQIRTIENFSEAVRKTPGQYIGYIGNKGFINMIREVLQNSMDELQKDDSPCTEIFTEYYEKDRRFVCIDNGRGIPFDNMQRIFASEHTSSNYEKKKGEFSSGRHGVGAKVTNALSSRFIVTSYMCKEVSPDGKPHARHIEFTEGMPWNKGEKEVPNKENYQGSRVEFTPSTTIMGPITIACEDVLNLINMLLPLMKIGAIINFHGVKENGKVIDLRLVNNDGIVTFLMGMTKNPLIPPICLSGENAEMTMKADIAFTWASDELDTDEYVLSFANMCPTINQSTHVTSFLDALANYFRQYMNKIYLANNNKITIQNSDIKSGLKAVVSAFHLVPMFSGQAKEIFSNEDMIPFIKTLVKQGLDEWIRTHPDDVQRVCKFFKSVATLRMKANKDKVQMLTKQVSALSGLPSKYEKPIGKKHLELLLIEGDSAKSACQNARDPQRQGLMPLRGKVRNAMACSRKDFFANEECKAIYTILDCGAGRDCDPDKCKYEKIIFTNDADMDGYHIRALLMKMFLVYYKPLVAAGRVYAALPPLFGLKTKENAKLVTEDDYLKYMRYFTDKSDYIQYIYNTFLKHNNVHKWNNKPYSKQELLSILYDNYNYPEDIKIICDDFRAEPDVVEMMYKMIVNNTPFSIIKKAVKQRYRFAELTKDNGIMVLEVTGGDHVQTIVFNNTTLSYWNSVLGKYIVPKMPEGYILNGKRVSLFELMTTFRQFTPAGLQRYKGLGEMEPVELKISTVHPDYNRTLLQYTPENMEAEIDAIRKMDSDLKGLLDEVEDIAGYDL